MKRGTILLVLVFQSFLIGLGTRYTNTNLNVVPNPKSSFTSVQNVGISNYDDYGGKIVAYTDYIYSIRNEGGFEIMNCSGSTMVSVGDFYTHLDIHDMKIEGSALYCLTSSGFQIFDLSTPTNPLQNGSSPNGDSVIAGIIGGYAYLFDMWQLFIYQIHDLNTLTHRATLQLQIDTNLDHIEAAIVKNNFVQAITRNGRLFSINVLNKSFPIVTQEIVTHDLSFVDGMVEHNNQLYAVGEPVGANGHLMIFDITSPDSPKYMGYHPAPHSYWDYDLVFDGDRFWVASGQIYLYDFNSGLREVNMYNVSSLRSQLPGVSQVLKHNGWLYMLQESGIKHLYRVDADAFEFTKSGDSPLEYGTTAITRYFTGTDTGTDTNSSRSTNSNGDNTDNSPFEIPGYNLGFFIISIGITSTILLGKKKKKTI